jgi:hypothetical protein
LNLPTRFYTSYKPRKQNLQDRTTCKAELLSEHRKFCSCKDM